MEVTPPGSQVTLGGLQWGRGAHTELRTSLSALPHAEEEQSHRNASTAVTTRSWGGGVPKWVWGGPKMGGGAPRPHWRA